MNGLMVIGVDESDGAVAAKAVGMQLATRLGLRVLLANVVDDGGRFPYGDTPQRERRRHAAHVGSDRLLETLAPPDPDVETRTTQGSAADALAELAVREDAALLVVGTRGRGLLRSALGGSVARALHRNCAAPVLVVPARTRRELGEQVGHAVVCGVDDTPSSAPAVPAAAGLASALGIPLVLVHVLRPIHASDTVTPGLAPLPLGEEVTGARRAEATELLERVAAGVGPHVSVSVRLEWGSAAEGLERVAAEERAAAIVIGSRGHGRLHSALVGSTSADLLGQTTTPVLVASPRTPLRAGAAA